MKNRFENDIGQATEAVLSSIQNFKRWGHLGAYDVPRIMEALEALYDGGTFDDVTAEIEALKAVIKRLKAEKAKFNRQQGASKAREAKLKAEAVERLATMMVVGDALIERTAQLGEALGDKNCSVRCHAIEALGKIGPEAVPLLQEALLADHPHIRAGAVDALGEMRPTSEAAMAGLAM